MKTSAILLLSNAANMMSAIFIPVFAEGVGATSAEIGIIGAVYGGAIFISSYLFGRASDMEGRLRFLNTGLLLSTLAFFLQTLARDPLELMIIRAFAGLCIGIYTAPLIAYEFEAGGRLGTFSAYGSLGWALGSILAGIIAQLGSMYSSRHPLLPFYGVFLLGGAFYLVSFLISLGLQEVKIRPVRTPLLPWGLIKRNRHIYLPMLLRHTGAFSIWVIFPLFLSTLGANMFWIGVIYFVNTGSQFLVMRRLDFADDRRLYTAGLSLSALVFFSYTLPGNYLLIMPFQFLLAVSFSLLYVGGLRYLTRTNEEKAATIGLMSSVTSISMAIGPLFGGLVAGSFGFDGVMYFASSLTLAGLMVYLLTRPGKGSP